MNLLEQIAWSLPGFIVFVLAPAVVRTFLDKLLGIDYYITGTSFEDALQSFTLTGLFYPFFEELIFRGIPLYLLGVPGAWLGTIIWAFMHPAWQLRYLAEMPLWKKVAATATSLVYYLPSGYFYLRLWMAGAGPAAIFWHTMLNTTVIMSEHVRELKREMEERGGGAEERWKLPRLWRWRNVRLEPEEPLFVRRREEEGEENEGETLVEGLRFVRKVRAGEDAVWEGEETRYRFVKQKKR